MFCYFDVNLGTDVPAYGRNDYVGEMFAFNALDASMGTQFGQAIAQTSPKKHSLDETEALVKQTLAATLKGDVASVTVESRETRRWPDADLGCAPRKGIVEPVPTDGFGFVLTHGGRRYVYRADTFGHVRQCMPARRVCRCAEKLRSRLADLKSRPCRT